MNMSYMAMPGIPRKEPEYIVPKNKKIEIINEFVCEYYGVSQAEMKSKSRKRKAADARHAVYLFLSWLTEMGPVEIGKGMKTDHTTVIYGREKMRDLLKIDPIFSMEVANIKKRIEKEFNAYRNVIVN